MMREQGVTDESLILQKTVGNPYTNVIETRGKNSYGVFLQPSYKHLYGKRINLFNKEEMDIIMNALYSTSSFFVKKEKIVSSREEYNAYEKWSQDITANDVVSMLTGTGMFKEVGTTYNGDIKILRQGSSAKHSGVVYSDTGIVKMFSTNTIFGDKDTLNPFDVFREVNGYTKQEALKQIINKNK